MKNKIMNLDVKIKNKYIKLRKIVKIDLGLKKYMKD
jgi:hypothetical protein